MENIDFSIVLERFLKYLIEGIAVGISCYFVSKKLNMEEIVLIGIIAAATFAILDMYTPQISNATRLGVGLGIGSQFTGIKMVG